MFPSPFGEQFLQQNVESFRGRLAFTASGVLVVVEIVPEALGLLQTRVVGSFAEAGSHLTILFPEWIPSAFGGTGGASLLRFVFVHEIPAVSSHADVVLGRRGNRRLGVTVDRRGVRHWVTFHVSSPLGVVMRQRLRDYRVMIRGRRIGNKMALMSSRSFGRMGA